MSAGIAGWMAGPWGSLAITLAIQALVSMSVLTVPAMAPSLAQALQVSPSLVGAYMSVVYACAMLSSMTAGPLVLRFGSIRMSQAGLLCCALGMGVLALSPTVPGAFVAALLAGLGYGPITPASSHVLARTTPPHRTGMVFSLKQTGVPLGGAMAGALVPPLLLAGGLAAPTWTVVAGCLTCLLLAQVPRAELDRDREPGRRIDFSSLAGPIRMVLRDKALTRLTGFGTLFSAMQLSLAGYVATYLHVELGWSLLAAGLALSVAQMGGIVGRILWGIVSDRWLGPHLTLALVAALMSLCAVLTAALGGGIAHGAVLMLMAAFGASATSWNGVYLALVARMAPPGMTGAATGGSMAITFSGVVLGPLIFGAIAGLAGSYRVGFAVLALPTAWSAWVLWRGTRAPEGQVA